MRALVTGGAGFVGSHVVDRLVARGDEVTVLDNLTSGRRENLAGAEAAGVEVIEADICDPAAVASAFDAVRPQTVLHLAAQIDVRVSVARPVFDLEVNVAGTINLLEQARAQDGCRVVFASTGGAIYGEGEGRDLPLSEAAACLPDAPYGLSKLNAEGYLSLYTRLYGVETTSLRLGNVYGPRQDPHGEAGVVAIFSRALLAGERPRVFGDGEQTRDYIYVDDVAAAFVAACEAPAGGPYNIGTGVETGVIDLGRKIAEACDVAFDPEPAPPRAGEVQRIAIDPALAARELGWRASHDLDRGLPTTVEWFRSAGA
jgi:UDP-glucose 4-epimerase